VHSVLNDAFRRRVQQERGRVIRSIRAIPPRDLWTQRVLVRIDPYDEEIRQTSPTLELLSSAGARVTVITEEPERIIESDIFCNEAFSLSHEVRASTIALAKKAKVAVAGLQFERQLNQLEAVLTAPESPVIAILGGKLSTTRLLLTAQIARRADRVFIGGELCIPFLLARNVRCAHHGVTGEMVGWADKMLEDARQEKRFIFTPQDFTVLNESDFDRFLHGEKFVFGPPLRNVTEEEINSEDVIGDIGPVTQWNWTDNFGSARTIFWHGPLGITECEAFSAGTTFLANALAFEADSLHRGIVCGQSLTASIRRARISGRITRYISSAASSALYYFAGQPLPAVEVLSERAHGLRKPCRILIPLTGTNRDAGLIKTAAQLIAPNTRVFLLYVRRGFDEERYPDFAAAMTGNQKYARRVESEAIFARANAILAEHGLIAAAQNTAQGKPQDIILRYAKRLGAQVVLEEGPSNILLIADKPGEVMQHAQANNQSAA
jgi:Phosphoglycerate kinase